ncbi:MAG: disulfide bond formation protein [Hyphomicrobiales bacterium]|nr:disulfide bond formation protein [Hyphomicrobiales bacterium]
MRLGSRKITPRDAALAVLVIAFATIAGAWIFEAFGYLPCELCLKQRWAYYVGVPLAAITLALAWRGPLPLARIGLGLLALVFLGSAIFGTYHAGVEWGFWPGPTDCTGSIGGAAKDMSDFMSQLQTTRVVRCDAVAIRIFGLSLAGWNAVISAFMTAVAVMGLRSR